MCNLGLQASCKGYLYYVDFFTSGVSDFRLFGLQYRSEDTLGSLSLSLVRDNGEQLPLKHQLGARDLEVVRAGGALRFVKTRTGASLQ